MQSVGEAGILTADRITARIQDSTVNPSSARIDEHTDGARDGLTPQVATANDEASSLKCADHGIC